MASLELRSRQATSTESNISIDHSAPQVKYSFPGPLQIPKPPSLHPSTPPQYPVPLLLSDPIHSRTTMTRGRRKDMTIPPSRALLQQRDYRARKAQYLTDLELRVKKAEEENVLLRKEVESLQAKLKAAVPPQAQSPYGPEVVRPFSSPFTGFSCCRIRVRAR